MAFIERQISKVGSLSAVSKQLPQHQAYPSPLEANYFLRPYVPKDVELQRNFMNDRKNPYDNRVFQSLYAEENVVPRP